MRVVLVPSSYAPHIGGIEEVVRQLSAHLRVAGDQVEVWTHRHPTTLPETEEVAGVQVRRFLFPLPSARASALVRWPAAAAGAITPLLGAMADFRPDLVHVHGFSGNGVYAAVSSLIRRKPLIVTLHGETAMDDQGIFDHSISLRLGLRLGLRNASAITAPSRFVLDDARRFGLSPSRARVIPNGVDLREAQAAAPVQVPFDRFVMTLGRMVPNKGFDLLLRAFARVASGDPGLGLVIAGDGPERDNLLVLARDLGIAQRLVMPGWLDRQQVGGFLSRATAFVLPSRLEPFGVVVLEAMRAGVPVVASSRGGVGEWATDGLNVLLVDPEDVDDFSATLDRVLDDPSVARRLVLEASGLVVAHSWETVTSTYRDLYREVLRS